MKTENQLPPIEQMVALVEEAPMDFMGTGSSWRAADKEEREWKADFRQATEDAKAELESLREINKELEEAAEYAFECLDRLQGRINIGDYGEQALGALKNALNKAKGEIVK